MNVRADKEYHEAMTFINVRQDALTAIVKARGNVKGHLGDLHIFSMDTEKVEVAYHPPPTGERKEVVIPIQPPLEGSWQARHRLKFWKDQIFKKWDVPAYPKVYYYKQPPMFPYTFPAVAALSVLLFALFGSGYYADWLRNWTATNLGPAFLKWAGYFAALMHLIVEPTFMLILTHKYHTPLVPRLKWLLCNMVVGYGALDEFRECIQYERLRIIYRQTEVGDIGPYVKGVADTSAKKTQ